jgi:signal transduction histidine kinase
MKKIKGTKRNKIIIYYLLAIVVPSVVLGMLAFRGVKNDQALVEREQRRALQVAGQQISDTIDANLKQLENLFARMTDSAAIPDQNTFTDSVISSFINSYPVLEGAFYVSGESEIAVLKNHLIYVPDNTPGTMSMPLPEQAKYTIEYGWRMEFVEKEYARAIEYFQNAMPFINNVQGQAEIHNSIARLQKKMGRHEDAISTYQTIIDSYPDIYIRGNIPLGMAALLESSLLYLQVPDTIKSLRILNELLVQIESSRWQINYPTYSNLISKINEIKIQLEGSIKESDALFDRTEDLLKNISLLEERTAYLLSVPELAGVIRSDRLSGNSGSNNRYLFERDGLTYFMFVSPIKENARWGLVYDQEEFLQKSIYSSVVNMAGESVFGWKLVNNYGNLLIGSEDFQPGENPVSVGLPPSLPPWTLVFYPKEGGILASFIQSGQGVFFYIFLLIVIILALGLFFTLYVINNELSLSRMKSNFISTVTHEFKSPLTSIRQMAEMLEGGRVSDKGRRERYYAAMVQESERLSHLIDNILDFSKMEAGQKSFFFEKANLAEVVEEMVNSFQTHLADMGFQVEYVLPEPVPDCFFDREAIRQVLQNLIDNAYKYSGDSKKIQVELTTNGTENIIKVRDFGIGIQEEEKDKIFSQFYRAGDILTQKVKGSGIGLTIVKQIVDAHKGHIKMESEPGMGSTFIVVLPLEEL